MNKKHALGQNKALILVLIVLGVLIVGLIIGIVIASRNGDNQEPNPTAEEDSSCLSMKDDIASSNCIAEKMAVGQYNEIDESYAHALDEAYEQKDYARFSELLIDEVSLYGGLGNQCDKAIKFLEDKRISTLPYENQATVYSYASDTMLECDNTEKYNELQAKLYSSQYDENGNLREVFYEPIEEENGNDDEE